MTPATWTWGPVSYHGSLRPRRFPWFTNNITLGSRVYMAHYEAAMLHPGTYAPTFRHEGTHVRQFAEKGWLWVILHPFAREVEARAAEQAAEPVVTVGL